MRTRMLLFFCLTFCVVSLMTTSGRAEETLTLDQAIDNALKNNQLIQGSRARLQAASENVTVGFSRFLPRLDIQERIEHTNSPPLVFTQKLQQEAFTAQDFQLNNLNHPSAYNNWKTQFILTQPIFDQGREWIGYQAAKTQATRTDMELARMRQNIRFLVEKAYYDTLLAQGNLDVLNSSLKTVSALEALASKRHTAGNALLSDLTSARVHKAQVEMEKIKAEGDLDVAFARLNKLMGMPQESSWRLSDAATFLNNQPELLTKSLNELAETAVSKRPDMAIAQKDLELGRLNTKQARFSYLPSVSLQGAYEMNAKDFVGSDGDAWAVAGVVSFNLFNGTGDRARIAAAKSEEQAVSHRVKDMEEQVRMEVREAYYNLRTAVQQREVARRSIENAQEAFRILQSRYNNGMALMVEVLTAETALKQAGLDLQRTAFEVLTAETGLKLRTGLLETR
ncbi:MAG: TolC family protein [Deltaproteobacteria bacterium]|nr:TolC family protein [Deltaproteobacteria bacterium]